jgi:exonuclease III
MDEGGEEATAAEGATAAATAASTKPAVARSKSTPAKRAKSAAAAAAASVSRATSAAGSGARNAQKGEEAEEGDEEEATAGKAGPAARAEFGSPAAQRAHEVHLASMAARPPGSLLLMSWNVNGLRAALRSGADQLFAEVDADIICLSEVKADESVVQKEFAHFCEPGGGGASAAGKAASASSVASSPIALAFAGIKAPKVSKPPAGAAASSTNKYHKYFSSAQQKGYSGTALLSKQKPLSVAYGLGVAEHDNEGRVITAEFDHFYVVATYVPNSGEGLKRHAYRTAQWDGAMLAHLRRLHDTNKAVIWCGDLNVAHHEQDIYGTQP